MVSIKYIDRNALINNLSLCQSCGKKIMVMVKADAYGHGVKSIARILKDKVDFWGVANAKEALELKKLIHKRSTILVVGKSVQFATLIKNNIDITIDTLEELKQINRICNKYNTQANIHIAINTGMNRLGVKSIVEFKQMLQFIKLSKDINLKGVFTHCFDEDLTKSHFEEQMAIFKTFVNCVKDKSVLIHIGGSFCLTKPIPKFVDMVRVGYFLYGYGSVGLQPVMSIESKIIKITHCKAGEFVGYGKTKLSKDTTIALIPLGYADGIPFNFAGGGQVKIKNKLCPIIGRICMDMLMVDVTNLQVEVGDKVIVFDNAKYYSQITNTSPYEILTHFAKARAKTIIK